MPGAKPSWFFARDQSQTRQRMGPGGVDARFGAAWAGFAPMLERWLTLIEGRSEGAVKQVYQDMLAGRVPPAQGHILSLAT